MFINSNSRFYHLCIWKILPPNIFRRCKYVKENIKAKNYNDMELESESDIDSDSDSDSDNDVDIDNEE